LGLLGSSRHGRWQHLNSCRAGFRIGDMRRTLHLVCRPPTSHPSHANPRAASLSEMHLHRSAVILFRWPGWRCRGAGFGRTCIPCHTRLLKNQILYKFQGFLNRKFLIFDEILLSKCDNFRKLQVQAADNPVFKASRRPEGGIQAQFRRRSALQDGLGGISAAGAPPLSVRRTRRADFRALQDCKPPP